VYDIGYITIGKIKPTGKKTTINGSTAMSGHMIAKAIPSAITIGPTAITAAIAAAPSSNPTSPRRHFNPQVRHAGALPDHEVKNAPRPPHHGQRLKSPLASIFGKLDLVTVAA
jgi:hypothetical protein